VTISVCIPKMAYCSSGVNTGGKTRVPTLVVSGPSGVGKGTLLKQLFQEFPTTFAYSISHTTRNPREGEVNGKDYYFVSREKFEEMMKKNEFLETASFSNNYYGTSKAAVKDIQETGRICIIEVEINGVKNIKQSGIEAKYLFIEPPSVDELENRLRKRASETPDTLKKRLNTAAAALEYARQPNVYDHIIINDDKDKAYAKLKEVLKEQMDKVNSKKANGS
ncbi:guanylate kinase-like isoform X1, partial [Argonauta hians]